MQTALVIIHVVIAVILTAIVLMQHGKQQGLSGAIAGGAETFFGKNKGRTVDAMLKKFTAVVAILFIISSVALTTVSINKYKVDNAPAEGESTEGENAGQAINTDENGNILNADGSIMTDEQGNPININQLQTAEGTEGDAAAAEGETVAEGEVTTEGEAPAAEGEAPAAEGEAPVADGEAPAAE